MHLPVVAPNGMMGGDIAQAASTIRALHKMSPRKGVVLCLGGDVMRQGYSTYICDWIDRGYISHIMMNGTAISCDMDLGLHGQIVVDEAYPNLAVWNEDTLNIINDVAGSEAAKAHGMGYAISMHMNEFGMGTCISKLAWQKKVPVTIHTAIGVDKFCSMASYDDRAMDWGHALVHDTFRAYLLARDIVNGGVILSIGGGYVMDHTLSNGMGRACTESGDFPKTSIFSFRMPGSERHNPTDKIFNAADRKIVWDIVGDYAMTIPAFHSML